MVAVLLASLTCLYLVFGTNLLVDRERLRLLHRQTEAFPLWVDILTFFSLGLCVFAIHFLLDGTRPLPRVVQVGALQSSLITGGLALARRIARK